MQFNEANPLAASRLGLAARLGDLETVRRLLDAGRRIDIGDNRGWTPLHEAVANKNLECLRLLLRRKGRKHVNVRTMEGETPLFLAIKHNASSDIINFLLHCGADTNIGNNESYTPLHVACENGHFEEAQLLVRAGAKLDVKDFSECTPFHYAILSGTVPLVKFLISEGGVNTDREEHGRTPLFLACSHEWDMVETVLAVDSNVNTSANDKVTPLMMACLNNRMKVVEDLLKRGADPNKFSDEGLLAIHFAVQTENLSLIQLLLRVTSKRLMRQRVRKMFSPLGLRTNRLVCGAISCKNVELLKLVLREIGSEDLQENLEEEDRHFPLFPDGFTDCPSISYHLRTNYEQGAVNENTFFTMLQVLIDHKYSVNASGQHSLPPLIAACLGIRCDDAAFKCIDILVKHGADIEHRIRTLNIPDTLAMAFWIERRELVLHLFKIGISGLPEDLAALHFRRNIRSKEMLKLLSKMGIANSSVREELRKQTGCHDMFQMCSLQQLCRTAVRKCLKQPFAQSLNQLPVFSSIKEYLTYQYQ